MAIATVSHLPRADDVPYVHCWAYQSGETLGVQAARLLIERLEGAAPAEPRCLKVPMQIMRAQAAEAESAAAEPAMAAAATIVPAAAQPANGGAFAPFAGPMAPASMPGRR